MYAPTDELLTELQETGKAYIHLHPANAYVEAPLLSHAYYVADAIRDIERILGVKLAYEHIEPLVIRLEVVQ